MPRYRSELDEVAERQGRVAAHAAALANLERQLTGRLDRSNQFAILVADTAIAENYSKPRECLAWLAASHRSWLRINAAFNEQVGRLAFYRYVLLPSPGLVRNLARRQALIDVILLHLHLQLWHGIICGVVFLDPRRAGVAKVLRDLNFVSIPSQHFFIDTPQFYQGSNIESSTVDRSNADRRLAQVWQTLFAGGKGAPIWLHYDEANYSGRRLHGWRWEAFRYFFRRLYGPMLRCSLPLCGRLVGPFELDHIAPVSKRFHQTLINFRPLCVRCNREKGDMVHEDPFQIKLLLPEELRTRELDDIQRQPPDWLGKVRPPQSASEIGKSLGDGS
jgi:hypothetical protein